MAIEKQGVEKHYMDMERLDVGEAFEEARNHLDIIADIRMHLQSQDPDAGEDGAWTHLSTFLQCKCAKIQPTEKTCMT